MSMPSPTRRLPTVALAILTSTVIGCAEEPPPVTEQIRAIRTITVAEPASGRTRRFSGAVEPADSSSISFEVSGVVEKLEVDVGDRVEAGQVVAIMDASSYELNVEAARAAVRRAEAEMREAENNWERERRMAREDVGATSQRALDRAEAARDSARQNLSYATSRLNLAKRDLDRTVLLSPFAGVVAARHVDAFQQVSRGEKIIELFMEGAMEAAISVPESEIDQVFLGLRGEVRFPALPEQVFEAIVSEKSEVAGAANAFPVRLTIGAEDARVRPGVTAEVTLVLDGDTGERAYLIPIGAVAPGAGESDAYVFRFDPDTSTVSRVAIRSGDVRDSNVVVEGGLGAGDIVAAAGVSFLRDGQKVKLMQ